MNRRRRRLLVAAAAFLAAGGLGAWSLIRGDAFPRTPAQVSQLSDLSDTGAPTRIRPSPTPPPWHGSLLAVAESRADGHVIALHEVGANAAPRALVAGFDEIAGLSWSVDGGALAFAGRREGNWDVYRIDRDGAGLARLTAHPAYDAWPTWSPDGRELVFVSYRDGNLDLYRMSSGVVDENIAAPEATITRITQGESPSIEPSWSPDGRWIAFSAWHDGAYRVEAVSLADQTRQVVAIAPAGGDLRQPAWSPDGRQVAYLDQRYGLGQLLVQTWPGSVATPAGEPSGVVGAATSAGESSGAVGLAVRPIADRALGFAWFPGGQALAIIAADRGAREIAIRGPTGAGFGQVARWEGGPAQLAWTAGALPAGLPVLAEPVRPRPASADPEARAGLERVDVAVSGDRIHADLAEDFAALRADVRAAVGQDFLGRLSDLWRPLGFYSSGSAFFSWHKTGRAFDTQMELRGPGGRRDMVLVRDEQGGRTMWRMFLRAAAQDGSVGRPLTEPGWTFAAGSGDPGLAAEGGRRAGAVPSGYWIDFTALAEAYGWRRIPSLTQSRLDWHRDWEAIEYWHYERRDGLRWFEAARQVYDDAELATQLHPDRLGALNIPFQRLARLGFPAIWPPEG